MAYITALKGLAISIVIVVLILNTVDYILIICGRQAVTNDEYLYPDSTGYEYFREVRIIYFRAYDHQEIEVIKKPEPVWLKGRKNKKDNFKLKQGLTMLYRITKTRKCGSKCSIKHCGKEITRNEWAYTSSKKHFCGSCGHLENQYADEGMARPAKVFYIHDRIKPNHDASVKWIKSITGVK